MKIHNRQGTYMEVDTREVKQEQFKQRPKLELRAYRQRQEVAGYPLPLRSPPEQKPCNSIRHVASRR